MDDQKICNVDVRLRYAVTGSRSAAEKALSDTFRHNQGYVQRIAGIDFEARNPIIDINPGACEGYTNYETFTIGVWLKNDRKLYDRCLLKAKDVLEAAEANQLGDLTPELAMGDWLQEFVEQRLLRVDDREEKASTDAERMFVSLAQAALSDVNWRELGEEWLDDVREG
jgi:hypothetical protein